MASAAASSHFSKTDMYQVIVWGRKQSPTPPVLGAAGRAEVVSNIVHYLASAVAQAWLKVFLFAY
jgi:hypothetical protein